MAASSNERRFVYVNSRSASAHCHPSGTPTNAGSGALLISGVVLAGGLLLVLRYLERPKNVDLLIETESELCKVSWPTVTEAIRSSVVVMVCVIVLMVFLAGADFVLGRWAVLLLT